MVLVHDVKKGFYKKFLYEPFPVESSLLSVLADHLNAEVVAGTIQTRQDALDYMTWTFFFRRLLQNPSYYGMEEVEDQDLNTFLSGVVGRALDQLELSYCLQTDEDGRTVHSTVEGRIASYYYLAHTTLQHLRDSLKEDMTTEEVLQTLGDATEFDQLPVRHNEDNINSELAKQCPLKVNTYTMDSPNTKTNLLLQSHFSRLTLPSTDYLTDTKSVLDNAPRVLQAMVDVAGESGWLGTTLRVISLLQMCQQARWDTDSSLLTLPHLLAQSLYVFSSPAPPILSLPQLLHQCAHYEDLARLLRAELEEEEIEEVWAVMERLPRLEVSLQLNGESLNTRQPSPVRVWQGRETTLTVGLSRRNKPGRQGLTVHSPRFPKHKDEAWLVVVGDPQTRELLALKRVGGVRDRVKHSLVLSPDQVGRQDLVLYVMSDCYLGLDQQFSLPLQVEPAEEEIFYSDED